MADNKVSVRFTAKVYANRLSGFIAAANNIDKATADNAKAINQWAQMAAAGISTNSLTLEAVKEGIIAQFPKAETLGDCGNTVKGRFYAFQRIANAGALDRLIAGEALNTVAKDCAPKQQQKAGKRSKSSGNKKSKALTLNECLVGLNGWLDTAMADKELAASMAGNELLAQCVAKIGKLSSIALTAAAPKARAKATAKPKARKAKAVTAVVQKKAA